jgi:transcriptional regulator with XRE-family HTH domain
MSNFKDNNDSDDRRRKCAERILQRLVITGIDQAELARRSGVSKSAISHYTHARNAPTNITAGKLARVLGADPVWLSGFDVPSQPKKVPRELDSDTTEKALELYADENARILLDAKRVLTEEDLAAVVQLVRSLANKR